MRAGFDENGLPTAVQITGAPWREADVLRATDSALADLPPGVIATWNGAAFDLPFLADHRAKAREVKRVIPIVELSEEDLD